LDNSSERETATWGSVTWFVRNWVVIVAGASSVGFVLALSWELRNLDHTHRYPLPTSRNTLEPAAVAGEYYKGDGLGENLSLSILPDGRYSLISSGCTGVDHRESGFVQERNGQYVLAPTKRSGPSIDRNFVLVGWGQRRYLIPPDEMQELRDAIIDGHEPREDSHGRFYIREPIAPAEALPDSPPAWADSLREGLRVGKVMAVSDMGPARVDRATVNLGSKDGLREGDVLTVQIHGPYFRRRFLVVSVADHSCEADGPYPDTSEYPLEPGLAVLAVVTEVEDRPR
jgi:hypothetical protein